MENKNEKKDQMKKIAKKGLNISLCAVLAGGLAAGAFEGVNTLTGWNQAEKVQAAIQEDDGIALLKSEKKSEDKAETVKKGSLDVSEIAEEAMPSVVSITTKSLQEVQAFYGMFGYGQGYTTEQEVEGSGSGIIIGKNDEQLLIATNYHVVEGADTVSVSFIDGESYEAAVKGFDEDKDLAVVSVPLDDISKDTMNAIAVASIGSSDDLKVGEQVVAIGNALGYGQSVTTGIVSAKNRKMDENAGTFSEKSESDDYVNLIQTDAAINPGNSGGALLNMDGEVVGINSAKLASTAVEGMGYAIAISDVADILEDLMNETPREKIEDGAHGIIGIQGTSVSSEGVQVYGMPEGVFVAEVTEGGPADEAGIKKNYIITEFDGKRVRSIEKLVELLKYYEPGEEIEVTMQIMDSEGYKEKTTTVTLGKSTESDSEKEDSKETKDDSEDRSLLEDWEDEQEQEDEEDMDRMPSIEEFFRQWN